jgi:hypothetical protein
LLGALADSDVPLAPVSGVEDAERYVWSIDGMMTAKGALWYLETRVSQ